MVIRRNPDGADTLVSPATNGTGMGHEGRDRPVQQQNLSRETSQQNSGMRAAESSQVERPNLAVPGPSGLPPSYAESVGAPPSIASGGPASDDKSSTGSLLSSDSDAESDGLDVESLQDDEEDWALDEAVPDPPSYEEVAGQRRTSDELVQDVLVTSHRPVQQLQAPSALPCPVILPQRRPGDKGRGFVRAYAPVLLQNGIGQEQFLAFLKSFHKASQASPLFTAIQVSSSIASFAPSVIALAVATATDVAAQAGREILPRQRANHFLDRMNEEVFKPAGLYAMVVKYKKDFEANRNGHSTEMGAHIGIGTERINLTASHAIAKYNRTASNESSHTLSSRMQNLRLASDTNEGSIELVEAAPLIFPYLDRAIDLGTSSENTKDRFNDSGVFLQDYKDRRTQGIFALNNLDRAFTLAEDQKGLKSRVNDPVHPMCDNGLFGLGLAPGGILAAKRQRRLDKYAYKLEKRIDKRLEKSQEKVLKYEQKLAEGRSLSRHKQTKYERHANVLDAITNRKGSLCGRSRSGLVGSLLTTAMDASGYSEKQPVRETYQHNDGVASRSIGSSSSIPSLAYGGPPSGSQSLAASRHQAQREARRAARAGGPVRRRMKEDVLYLMIVNMPSEVELAEARELLGIPRR
nr:uncharacterized protein LOC112020254 [Quercus suber]